MGIKHSFAEVPAKQVQYACEAKLESMLAKLESMLARIRRDREAIIKEEMQRKRWFGRKPKTREQVIAAEEANGHWSDYVVLGIQGDWHSIRVKQLLALSKVAQDTVCLSGEDAEMLLPYIQLQGESNG